MIFARWALYTSACLVIGAFGVTLLGDRTDRRVIRVAQFASIALLASAVLMFLVQRYIWFSGDDITAWDNAWLIVSSTVWGQRWTWLFLVALVAVIVTTRSRARTNAWIYLSGALAAALAGVVPLTGHGGSHGGGVFYFHVTHLAGAGLWLGSLSVALAVSRRDAVAFLTSLRRFAPMAMTGAAMTSASGLVLAWEHMDPLSLLWTSDYGRVLIAKAVAALAVGALGFVNWRRMRFSTVSLEVALAIFVVLGLAAWLSELPLSMRMKH